MGPTSVEFAFAFCMLSKWTNSALRLLVGAKKLYDVLHITANGCQLWKCDVTRLTGREREFIDVKNFGRDPTKT